MAAITKRKQIEMKIDTYCKNTKFNRNEIEKLLNIFGELTKNKQKMDRSMFRDVLHNQFEMSDDIIMDRVFKVFDKDNDAMINLDEWVKGMSGKKFDNGVLIAQNMTLSQFDLIETPTDNTTLYVNKGDYS